MKAKQISTILGLAFEGGRLSLCLMQRVGGRQLRVEENLNLPLTLDPLNDEPELVGREIRNHLDEAGIHERRCAVCLPLKWMLTLHADLPDLSGEDLNSFIALQAERSFPFSPEDLAIAESRLAPAEGPAQATLMALSRHSLGNLQSLLKAAGLHPLTITTAVATLPRQEASAVLLAGGGGLDLAILAGGGVAAVRSLGEAMTLGSEGARWDFDLIARQARITLGRLPEALRGEIKTLRILGAPDQVEALARGMRDGLAVQGLVIDAKQVRVGGSDHAGEDKAFWSPAYAVAACCMEGRIPIFEFLPPHVSRFKQLAGRISARRALYLGGGAIGIILLVATTFTLQGLRLRRLEREWTAMKPKVERVEALQRSVRAFRPWFGSSVETLAIAAHIASAFPAEGTVWVKKIEIKDLSTVVCTGNASDNRDLLKLLDALRKIPGLADLQVSQVRGNSPLQFSLSFHWKGETSDAR